MGIGFKILVGSALIYFTLVAQINAKNTCYDAKTCIHDGKEKCGQDKSGKVRRFLDSCDLKEYNCLREASYQKVSSALCKHLPDIDQQDLKNSKELDSIKDVDNVEEGKSEEKESNTKDDDHEKEKDIKLNDSASRDEPDMNDEVDQSTVKPMEPGKAAVIKQYWCWRAKYCHSEGNIVCGRDRRLNEKRKFSSACESYKHNCHYGHDFTVTNMKFCKRY